MVDYLDHVSADGDQLLVAARAAGLDAPVPSCPGWVVRDLLAHVWEVHAHKELIVRSRLQEPPGEQREPPADGLLERGSLDAITVEGDPDGAAWLRELAAEDTQ